MIIFNQRRLLHSAPTEKNTVICMSQEKVKLMCTAMNPIPQDQLSKAPNMKMWKYYRFYNYSTPLIQR